MKVFSATFDIDRILSKIRFSENACKHVPKTANSNNMLCSTSRCSSSLSFSPCAFEFRAKTIISHRLHVEQLIVSVYCFVLFFHIFVFNIIKLEIRKNWIYAIISKIVCAMFVTSNSIVFYFESCSFCYVLQLMNLFIWMRLPVTIIWQIAEGKNTEVRNVNVWLVVLESS